MPKSKTYEEFVEKFKPKKTTDDCCTPPTIYEIVKQWPATNTGLTPPKLCGHDEEVCKIRGRPENSGRWLHPGWKPGRTKAGRKRYFGVRSAFVRARSGSQMGTFGPRESHHTAAWLVPCGGRRHQQNAPHRLRRPEGCHQRPEAGGVCGKEKLLCLFELEHGAKTCYNAVNQQCQGVQL